MTSVDSQTRDRLYRLLVGELDLEAFEAWFVANTWDERTPFVAKVDHLLAERSALSSQTLMDELWGLATTFEDTQRDRTTSLGTDATFHYEVLKIETVGATDRPVGAGK